MRVAGRRGRSTFSATAKGYASGEEEHGDVFLSLKPVPPIEEIACDPQFIPEAITAEEFESIWSARHYRDDTLP